MDEWHADVVEERKRNPPPPSKPMSEYEQDDRDTEKMLSGIDAAIVELRFMHTAPAAWARALEPGKYPCLCSVGKRAGRVGEDRFRGRYHPHLIYDRAAR